MRDWTNPRTGEQVPVPEGIDPGFGFNTGKAFLAAIGASPALLSAARAANDDRQRLALDYLRQAGAQRCHLCAA